MAGAEACTSGCTMGLAAWRALPDNWGLEESSEDSEEMDQAVPFSSSSWRRSMFCGGDEEVSGGAEAMQGAPLGALLPLPAGGTQHGGRDTTGRPRLQGERQPRHQPAGGSTAITVMS